MKLSFLLHIYLRAEHVCSLPTLLKGEKNVQFDFTKDHTQKGKVKTKTVSLI